MLKALVIDKWFITLMPDKLDDMISQADAARIRGVTPQAIGHLIRTGKLRVVTVAGRRLVFRSEVENYKPSVGGRPKGKQSAKKQIRQRKSK